MCSADRLAVLELLARCASEAVPADDGGGQGRERLADVTLVGPPGPRGRERDAVAIPDRMAPGASPGTPRPGSDRSWAALIARACEWSITIHALRYGR
ncbi:hypothetical protein GCM10009678_62410 [Actinomadura kijaniata]